MDEDEIHQRQEETRGKVHQWWGIRTTVALIIVSVWAVSYIGSLVTGNYTGFEVSTPVMLMLGSYLLASDVARRKNGNSRP